MTKYHCDLCDDGIEEQGFPECLNIKFILGVFAPYSNSMKQGYRPHVFKVYCPTCAAKITKLVKLKELGEAQGNTV